METLQSYNVTPMWLLIVFIFNCISYFSFRHMVHTVVMLDRDDPGFPREEDKVGFTFWQRRMWCYEKFATDHKKDFRFWCRVTDIFVIVETILFVVTILAIIILPSDIEYWFLLLNTFQATGIMLLTNMTWFFSDTNRDTKYERELYKRRNAQRELRANGNNENNSNNQQCSSFELKVKEYDENGDLKDPSEKEDI